ncbi:MAG: hypothetical protein AAB089_02545 [Nitrospirota bacterium]
MSTFAIPEGRNIGYSYEDFLGAESDLPDGSQGLCLLMTRPYGL